MHVDEIFFVEVGDIQIPFRGDSIRFDSIRNEFPGTLMAKARSLYNTAWTNSNSNSNSTSVSLAIHGAVGRFVCGLSP